MTNLDTNAAAAPKAPKAEKRIDQTLIDAAMAGKSAAVFTHVKELGATAGQALDAQPKFAIEVASAIANGSLIFEPAGKGPKAKPNNVKMLVQVYSDARQTEASHGAKTESAAALTSRIQKIAEAAEHLRSKQGATPFVDVIQSALAYRVERSKLEKGLQLPFEYLYQIAQEQVRQENGKAKYPDNALPEDVWHSLAVKPAADSPELPAIIKSLRDNLEALMKRDYRGVTVLSDSPVFANVLEAFEQMHSAMETLDTAANEKKAADAAAAKADADAAIVAAAEDERKARVASLSEEDAMAQFMAEWRAARGVVETPAVERKPAKGRKAA